MALPEIIKDIEARVKDTGDTMTGTLKISPNITAIQFRDNVDWSTTISYQTYGNEALTFSTKNAATSFIFINGVDNITTPSTNTWTTYTAPGLQIKNNCISIGKLFGHNENPTYKFYVEGTAYTTSLTSGAYVNAGTYLKAGSYANIGTYITAGTHINAKQGFGIDDTSGTGIGISLYNGSTKTNAPIYGLMFAKKDNFGSFGDVTGAWATYFTMDQVGTYGWIYRAGTTNVASVSANGIGAFGGIMKDIGHILSPKGGSYTSTTASVTGYLKITLPVSWTNAMIRFVADIYDFSSDGAITYIFGGYNYKDRPGWANTSAECISKKGTKGDLAVRFGHDGSKCAIYIGESSTVWKYPQVIVRDVLIGFSQANKIQEWSKDWSISFTTTLGSDIVAHTNTNLLHDPYLDGRYVNVTGDTMVGLLTAKTGSSQGFKVGSAYITAASATNGEVVLQGGHLRFGSSAWDYNTWAGLSYDSSNKIIALGLADNNYFTANSAQSGGTLTLPAVQYLAINGKTIIDAGDAWLRINDGGAHSSGVYFGTSIVRTDGSLQVGSGGSKFYANSSGNGYFSGTLGVGGTNTNYKLYVSGAGCINTSLTVGAYITMTNTNPYVKFVDTAYSNATYYIQGYQGKLAFGPTFDNAAQMDLDGNLTLKGGASFTPRTNQTGSIGTSNYNWKDINVNTVKSNTTLYVTSSSTLYLDSASGASLIFRPQGTEQGRFNTSGKLQIKSAGKANATITGPDTAGNFYFPNTGGTFVTHVTRGIAEGGVAQPVYIAATGRATKLTADVGTEDRPVYLKTGVITATTYRMAATNAVATTAFAINDTPQTGIWYVNDTANILGQSDGVAIVNKCSDAWITQIYQDYRTGQLAVRGKNNNVWQSWRTIIDSSNFTSYLDDTYVNTGGDTMTGDLKFTNKGIVVVPGNTDQYIWKVYSITDGTYGFRAQYNGTGAGNNNSFSLIADNQEGAEVNAIEIKQNGTMFIAKKVTANGGLDMNNSAITNIGDLAFADPGVQEGITWTGGNGWWIYESPDNLTNAAGNLQFVHGQTRRLTINTDGYVDINARLVVRGNGSSYNEGIRILPAPNGWSNIFFSADNTLSGTHDGGWLIGRRGTDGSTAGTKGDFTIEEEESSGVNLTIHKNSGGATLQGALTVNGSIIAQHSGTNDRSVKASNSNGVVGVYASTNRGLYDFTAGSWMLYVQKSDNTLRTGRYFYCDNTVQIAKGLIVTGRSYGAGDDEGIVVTPSDNGYAGISLGSNSGIRSTHYLLPASSTHRAVWRYNNGTASYDITHPETSGEIVVHTADAAQGSATLPVYVNASGVITACTASSVFSALSWTAGKAAGPVLNVTIAGQKRTATIPSASGSASGVVTTKEQTFAGAKTFADLLTQGNPSTDTTIASMNRFEADLFVAGNGSAPNKPQVAGFYLGRSTDDENRHMDIVSGGQYSYIDFNKASVVEDYRVRILADVESGLTQIMWSSSASEKKLQVDGEVSASTFTGPVNGNASSATKLTSSAGSTTRPIYFSSGKPAGISYVATAYGGTGVTSHTANRLVWSSSTTAIKAADSHYADSSKIGVNYTSAPSYNLYVNGTTGVSGATTLSSTLSVSGATTLSSTLSVAGRSTLTGKVSIPTGGQSWIGGKTVTNASIAITTKQTTNSYHPILAVQSSGGHTWNIGGLGNSVGIYGFFSNRTENGTDYSTIWDTSTGNITHSKNLTVKGTVFGYNYTNSNNAAAFIWDKPSSHYTGVGACGTNNMIHFGPCNADGTWVASYDQIWRFQGSIAFPANDARLRDNVSTSWTPLYVSGTRGDYCGIAFANGMHIMSHSEHHGVYDGTWIIYRNTSHGSISIGTAQTSSNGYSITLAGSTYLGSNSYVNGTLSTAGNITATKASGSVMVTAKRSDTNARVSIMVGSGGVNRGLYDNALDKWILYSNGTDARTSMQLYGAVWNDYAEFRDQQESVKPGYCVASSNNGKVYKTTKRLQACDGIVSDTFGFAIGETEESKTPLAVAGRVLAYCEGSKYDYQAGDTVCAGPEGKVCKMTREEIREWPDRIVGIVSEIPEYEIWGSGNVPVNGRIWIKIK